MVALQAAGTNRWQIPRRGDMKADVQVYLNATLRSGFDEATALEQLMDAAALPGVVSPVLGMPDLHQGYGLPIGGVLAVRAESGDTKQSIVSAGAVGYDINCGVRLLGTELASADLSPGDLRRMLDTLIRRIPPGVGKSSRYRELEGVTFESVVLQGASALVRAGYGRLEDLEAIEEFGALSGARLETVSDRARQRADQLATIGGGNHFIELGTVSEVYDESVAEIFGLRRGQLTIMIHTGSRGFGHEICTDYTRQMARKAPHYDIQLPSKGLACVPIDSPEGKNYLAAMACAVNYAFANRQLMTHEVREAFRESFGRQGTELGLHVVYDVAHNIAKFEEHGGQRMLVHRKGATRALAPGHPDNPPRYRETGHPVLIPGTMGTRSYVAVGTAATAETFFSANHGAGRVLSRTAARKQIDVAEFHRQLGGVLYGGIAPTKVLDEAPGAYKDIDQVVETLAEIGLTRKVACLTPLAVIKGA